MSFLLNLASDLAAISIVLAGLFLVPALRRVAGSMLDLQLQKALENHRSLLQKDIEQERHRQAESLTRIRTELDRVSDLLSRRSQKEFEVVHQAWTLLVKAVGAPQGTLTGLRFAPGFLMKNEDETRKLIESLPTWDDDEKELLRRAHSTERDDVYWKIARPKLLADAYLAHQETKNFINLNRIFVHSSILQKMIETEERLYSGLLKVDMAEPDEFPRDADRIFMKELNADLDELEKLIRERFQVDDK